MKQVAILLLVVCAFYMVNEADAWWYGGGGRRWNYRPYSGYYGYYRPYYPYYYNPYAYWKRSLEGPQRLECTYTEGKSLLSCAGSGKNVECETIRVFDSSITKPFTFYAIGAHIHGDAQVDASRVYFDLYPEMVESKGWLNSTFIDGVISKSYTYSLYFNQEFSFGGFRVKDLECFRNLTSFFGGIEANETISVSLAADRKEDIKVLGGILLS